MEHAGSTMHSRAEHGGAWRGNPSSCAGARTVSSPARPRKTAGQVPCGGVCVRKVQCVMVSTSIWYVNVVWAPSFAGAWLSGSCWLEMVPCSLDSQLLATTPLLGASPMFRRIVSELNPTIANVTARVVYCASIVVPVMILELRRSSPRAAVLVHSRNFGPHPDSSPGRWLTSPAPIRSIATASPQRPQGHILSGTFWELLAVELATPPKLNLRFYGSSTGASRGRGGRRPILSHSAAQRLMFLEHRLDCEGHSAVGGFRTTAASGRLRPYGATCLRQPMMGLTIAPKIITVTNKK